MKTRTKKVLLNVVIFGGVSGGTLGGEAVVQKSGGPKGIGAIAGMIGSAWLLKPLVERLEDSIKRDEEAAQAKIK